LRHEKNRSALVLALNVEQGTDELVPLFEAPAAGRPRGEIQNTRWPLEE